MGSAAPDWNDLRVVLAIFRSGSLAGAARALAVNHSTVFRRLNAFEERIGARLFERLPGGYAATVEGEAIRPHAEAAEAAILALERQAAGKDYRLAGRVRITTAPNLAIEYLATYVADFRHSYPDIVVEIAAGDHDYDLARREADIALRATSQPPEFLVGRQVAELPWLVYAGRAWLREHPAPFAMPDLAGLPLVGADDSLLRLPVFAWQRRHYAESQFVARANDLNTMRALALAGIGLAMLPRDQAHPGLVELFAVDPPFRGQLWLLTHPDLRHVARIKACMAYLAQRLAAEPRLHPDPQPPVAPAGKAPRTRRKRR